MDKQSFVLYFMSLMLMSTALKIKNLRVPEEVFDKKSAILDCDYEPGNDTKDLVVKWFQNDYPIYQWILNHEPQEMGKFVGKLDLSYNATDDEDTMYRAIKIRELSLDMAGVYTCVVFTFSSEDRMSKEMIVIHKPEKFELLQLNSEEDTISISCVAYGVYPEPMINISYSGSNEFDDIDNQTLDEEGLYVVTQIVSFKADSIEENADFTCELTIPNTNYTDHKELSFIADNAATLASTWIMILAAFTTLLST